jgi:hypothetical protein
MSINKKNILSPFHSQHSQTYQFRNNIYNYLLTNNNLLANQLNTKHTTLFKSRKRAKTASKQYYNAYDISLWWEEHFIFPPNIITIKFKSSCGNKNEYLIAEKIKPR